MQRILLLGALALVLGLCAGCEHDACSPDNLRFTAEAEFTAEIPVTEESTFGLYGINGDVDLIGGGPGESIRLSARRYVRSDSREDAERGLEDLQVQVYTEEDDIQVRTLQPQDTEGGIYTIDYTVHVPEDCHARAIIVNGDIRAGQLAAGAYLRTTNGTVDAVGLLGAVHLTTTNGNITADLPIATSHDVSLSSINGNLALIIPAGASAKVHLAVTNGLISTHGLDWEASASSDRTFVGRLGSGDAELGLSTTNGNISIRAR